MKSPIHTLLTRFVTPLCGAAILFGCAYYNGLYNANRLAGEARKAGRDGRTGEARSLWSRVVVKTDSVLARYPNSGYRDDALLLRGIALHEIGSCSQAVDPLREVVDSSPDPRLRSRAALTLARCHLALERPDSAVLVLSPLVEDPTAGLVDEAYWVRGTAFLAQEEYELALEDLTRTDEELAAFDRARVLSELDRGDEAVEALIPMVNGRYSEERWQVTLGRLGRLYPARASRLTDSVLARGRLTRAERARILIADGLRLSAHGMMEEAAVRYEQAVAVAGDPVERYLARVYSLMDRVRTTRDLGEVPLLLEGLVAASSANARAAVAAGPAVVVLGKLVGDSTESAWSDLDGFLLAEELRDSLAAYALAATQFQAVAEAYPNSILAPKALLAAAAIDPKHERVLLTRARAEYPNSPYILALTGEGDERFAILEDSLLALTRGRNSRELRDRELRGVEPAGDGDRGFQDDELGPR